MVTRLYSVVVITSDFDIQISGNPSSIPGTTSFFFVVDVYSIFGTTGSLFFGGFLGFSTFATV